MDASIPWDFFWALDANGKPILLLQHSPLSVSPIRVLPPLEGIEVERNESESGHKLLFRLIDPSQIDIFHRLCLDIISSAATAFSEEDAVRLAIARTWRWHHLLRGGTDGKLSNNQQKGLIGELLFLERYLLQVLQPVNAVSCWTGPQGAPKDFEIGEVCVEVKARREAATPFIRISSADQLDDSMVGRLFLCVVNLSASVQSGNNGVSVTDMAVGMRSKIRQCDIAAAELFEERLAAAGFRWEDDYTDSKWLLGTHSFYKVAGLFPRITSETAGLGVSRVGYDLSLQACLRFLVNDEVVLTALGEA